MNEPKVAPYGSWKSPITSDLIVADTVGLSSLSLDGDDIYWIESRPNEGGRNVVVKRTSDCRTQDITPAPFNARTRVHEYGGGAYLAVDGIVFFSNYADQRAYRQDPGSQPRPITPETQLRYADYIADPTRNRLVCVREDHTVEGQEAVNTLASLSMDGDETGGQALVSGNDFYASPRISPDGSQIAWLTWNHPNMPWDGTELWLADFTDRGTLHNAIKVAGGPQESIFQPEWSPDGKLYFTSDRTGWWNLYRWRDDQVEPLCQMEAEFGLPQWVFKMSSYALESANRIICAYNQHGISHLASLDVSTGKLKPIPSAFTHISDMQTASGRALFLASSYTTAPMVVQLNLPGGGFDELRYSSEVAVDPGYITMPQPVEFPTEGGLTAHAFLYRPRNCDYVASRGEKPPLLVMSHGGPTRATAPILSLRIQYWTSRGVAVLDVNYGGSTGYGRAYRQRLNGQWGVVDVDDCVNGARYLVEKGEVDGERLMIRGGSAGGYTTLCALTFRDTFKAGASYYGVSDLEALVKDTHKFEAHYEHNLVGPYPERRDLYYERSAINFTDRLSCPIIFFQGLEDKVVPPSQTETMVNVLRAKGVPVAYIPFEGEQHGFRRAENIKRSLDAEFYFYSKIFGYQPADEIEPVEIENL